jgi:transposase
MRELAEIVETGPDPSVDGVVRWPLLDLKRVIEERFAVTYSVRTISELLRGAGVFLCERPVAAPQTGPAGAGRV